jgi:uncharacterized protein YciI
VGFFCVVYGYRNQSGELDAHRPAHRAFLGELHERGVVAIAGPLGRPGGGGGLILVRAGSVEEAGAVMDGDPFMTAGLIASREIWPWTQVYGPLSLDG